MPTDKVLYPHLSKRWRRHHEMLETPDRVGGYIARGIPYGARYNAWPPSGQRPGSDLNFLREQLFDFWDIEYGILNCLTAVLDMPNLEYAAAFARAVNDWQIEEWLEPEPRLRASMIVPVEDAELAVHEIDRLACIRDLSR